MAEIVFTIAAKATDYIIDLVASELRYCCSSGDITEDFGNQRDLMTITHQSVENRVTEALNNTEITEKEVEKWLNQASKLKQDVENLEKERRELGRCCFTWRKYRINKQMSKKTNKMRELLDLNRFEIVSRPAALPSIEYFPYGNFQYFESTKLACQKLMEAITEETTFMVGLYGMGGSGKTTLVKEVGRKAKELKPFDHVVFTTVSQTPNVRRIQGEIADLLGLKLNEESEAGRARRIHLRLTRGESILLILDDVWGKLNLEDIGVHQGCTILLTTRLKQLCSLMGCQESIHLNLLSEEESWKFFQHHGCILDRPSWLSEGVARDIAKECKGLPIAIEAVGTTLKGKSLDEWNLALHQLKHSKPLDMEEGVRDAFTCLKFSYDYLRSNVAKSLFLMCGLFPEDHDISREDLFRYGMGLGLCKEIKQFETARNQVNSGINHLIESCLLTHSEKGKDHLKMHDIVRDVSLWITSKNHGRVMVNPDEEAMKECFAISSWYMEDNIFPREFDAPKFEILLLNIRNSLDLSCTSFQCLKALKVLSVVNENYQNKLLLSLPQSADSSQLLPNLQTLRLVGLELHDISFIASLKGLEILELRASHFKELPKGIIELKKLRLLDLSWCQLDEDCYKVIGKCVHLKEIYLLNDPRCI